MSDLLHPDQGARPWLPASNVTVLEVLNEYDVPLSGLVDQGGTTYLYSCLFGEMDDANIWAYGRVDEVEVEQLRSLLDGDLAAAIDTALTDRMLIVAIASGYELVNWLRIDAGVEGPLGIAKRFLAQMATRL